MCYKNGKEILPKALLKEIQKYIQGDIVYIPKSETRVPWGESNGTRQAIKVHELSFKYSLSEDSIRKIIFKINTAFKSSQIDNNL